VPHCEVCDRFYTEPTITPDGRCPQGHVVATSGDRRLVQSVAGDDEDARVRAPWHFWLLVAALVLYLGWRLVQGIGWLVG
jgi:hypothetical protein